MGFLDKLFGRENQNRNGQQERRIKQSQYQTNDMYHVAYAVGCLVASVGEDSYANILLQNENSSNNKSAQVCVSLRLDDFMLKRAGVNGIPQLRDYINLKIPQELAHYLTELPLKETKHGLECTIEPQIKEPKAYKTMVANEVRKGSEASWKAAFCRAKIEETSYGVFVRAE